MGGVVMVVVVMLVVVMVVEVIVVVVYVVVWAIVQRPLHTHDPSPNPNGGWQRRWIFWQRSNFTGPRLWTYRKAFSPTALPSKFISGLIIEVLTMPQSGRVAVPAKTSCRRRRSMGALRAAAVTAAACSHTCQLALPGKEVVCTVATSPMAVSRLRAVVIIAASHCQSVTSWHTRLAVSKTNGRFSSSNLIERK
jgi:hypothetical protein